jgi:hypothetical protein
MFRRNISPPSSGPRDKLSKKPVEVGRNLNFLLTLAFNPEDGSDMFLSNVRLSPNYTALQSKDRTLEQIHCLHR